MIKTWTRRYKDGTETYVQTPTLQAGQDSFRFKTEMKVSKLTSRFSQTGWLVDGMPLPNCDRDGDEFHEGFDVCAGKYVDGSGDEYPAWYFASISDTVPDAGDPDISCVYFGVFNPMSKNWIVKPKIVARNAFSDTRVAINQLPNKTSACGAPTDQYPLWIVYQKNDTTEGSGAGHPITSMRSLNGGNTWVSKEIIQHSMNNWVEIDLGTTSAFAIRTGTWWELTGSPSIFEGGRVLSNVSGTAAGGVEISRLGSHPAVWPPSTNQTVTVKITGTDAILKTFKGPQMGKLQIKIQKYRRKKIKGKWRYIANGFRTLNVNLKSGSTGRRWYRHSIRLFKGYQHGTHKVIIKNITPKDSHKEVYLDSVKYRDNRTQHKLVEFMDAITPRYTTTVNNTRIIAYDQTTVPTASSAAKVRTNDFCLLVDDSPEVNGFENIAGVLDAQLDVNIQQQTIKKYVYRAKQNQHHPSNATLYENRAGLWLSYNTYNKNTHLFTPILEHFESQQTSSDVLGNQRFADVDWVSVLTERATPNEVWRMAAGTFIDGSTIKGSTKHVTDPQQEADIPYLQTYFERVRDLAQQGTKFPISFDFTSLGVPSRTRFRVYAGMDGLTTVPGDGTAPLSSEWPIYFVGLLECPTFDSGGTIIVDDGEALKATKIAVLEFKDETYETGWQDISNIIQSFDITHDISTQADSLNMSLILTNAFEDPRMPQALYKMLEISGKPNTIFPKDINDRTPRIVELRAGFDFGMYYEYTPIFTGVMWDCQIEDTAEGKSLAISAFDYTKQLDMFYSPNPIIYASPPPLWGDYFNDYLPYVIGTSISDCEPAPKEIKKEDRLGKRNVNLYTGWDKELSYTAVGSGWYVDADDQYLYLSNPAEDEQWCGLTSPHCGGKDFKLSFTLEPYMADSNDPFRLYFGISPSGRIETFKSSKTFANFHNTFKYGSPCYLDFYLTTGAAVPTMQMTVTSTAYGDVSSTGIVLTRSGNNLYNIVVDFKANGVMQVWVNNSRKLSKRFRTRVRRVVAGSVIYRRGGDFRVARRIGLATKGHKKYKLRNISLTDWSTGKFVTDDWIARDILYLATQGRFPISFENKGSMAPEPVLMHIIGPETNAATSLTALAEQHGKLWRFTYGGDFEWIRNSIGDPIETIDDAQIESLNEEYNPSEFVNWVDVYGEDTQNKNIRGRYMDSTSMLRDGIRYRYVGSSKNSKTTYNLQKEARAQFYDQFKTQGKITMKTTIPKLFIEPGDIITLNSASTNKNNDYYVDAVSFNYDAENNTISTSFELTTRVQALASILSDRFSEGVE